MNKLLMLILTAGIVFGSVAMAGTTLYLEPVQDATVDSFNSDTNYGAEDYLSIQGQNPIVPDPASTQRTFLMFDLTSIPDTAEIVTAELWLCCYDFSTVLNPQVELHYVDNDDWIEVSDSVTDGITWDNMPIADIDTRDMGNVPTINNDTEWFSWNLLLAGSEDLWTDYSDDLQDGNLSLMIQSLNENSLWTNYANFYSQEYSNEELWPYLKITYIENVIPAPGAICLVGIGVVFVRRLRFSL